MDREFGPRFSLAELVEATGVPARTIRYYISQGLAPPAQGAGRSAFYTAEHVEALTKVVELRGRNLTIEEVRSALAAERKPSPAPGFIGEPWVRIVLHPHVEIHVRSDAPEHVQAFVRQVQTLAGEWFGDVPSSDSAPKFPTET